MFTDSSLEFGKSCEDLSWNHRTSTPHRSEINSIAERSVRKVKEGTFAVLLQSDSVECHSYFRNVQDLLAEGKNSLWKAIWRTIQRPRYSVWCNG